MGRIFQTDYEQIRGNEINTVNSKWIFRNNEKVDRGTRLEKKKVKLIEKRERTNQTHVSTMKENKGRGSKNQAMNKHTFPYLYQRCHKWVLNRRNCGFR